MAVFSSAEIFEFAARIEENGEKFYRHAAVITEEETARYLFNHLADEENKHRETFRHMAAQADPAAGAVPMPMETYPGEYLTYLRNHIDHSAVFNAQADREFAHICNTEAAIDFAMNREMDSILYYAEIKQLVPASGQALIDNIIAEERQHFMKLAEFKKEWTDRR